MLKMQVRNVIHESACEKGFESGFEAILRDQFQRLKSSKETREGTEAYNSNER